MATSSSGIFSGQSTFSADFQQVLTRAVSIASLPIQSLSNSVATLQSQQQTLTSMEAQFASLQTAVQLVSNAAKGSLSAVSTQATAASASVTSSALPGKYLIEVDSVGSSSTTLSKAGLVSVSDPSKSSLSTASAFTLTENGIDYSIAPTGSSLTDLANAINGSGAAVQATIVNVGSSTSPDYRLAVSGTKLGADTIQLNDGSQDLLDSVATGAPATYKVNGIDTLLQSDSSQVTLAPGLTVDLLQQTTSGQPATITVTSDYSALQNALQNLTTAYNSAVDLLNGQRGTNAGALAGLSTVSTLTNVLRQISQFTGSSGAITNTTQLGLTLDQNGHLNFDSSVFSSANTTDVQQFLGSTASGGFLKAANDGLDSIANSTSGLIQTETKTLGDHVTRLESQISDQQSRVDTLQANLQAQLSAADAAISTLQAQKSYFTSLFEATYLNNNSSSSNG